MSGKKPKILVAPLDWGLGHATRCIPIIKELIVQNCEVVVASSGPQKILLELEFPDLQYLELPGYGVRYSLHGGFMPLQILLQLPKILIQIKREHRWLMGILASLQPDALISDNRYGLYAPGLPTALVTHQLAIRSGMGTVADRLLLQVSNAFVNRFSQCWIPDKETGPSLAGLLSHPAKMPRVALHYIGLLSRFSPIQRTASGNQLLVLISGPEPQRTVLEKMMLEQLQAWPVPAVLVRGLPDAKHLPIVSPAVTIYNHLPASAMEALLQQSSMVISRAGYSTVMDLVTLGKRSILIPTPGQTEQEYLAGYLMQQHVAYTARQAGFDLRSSLDAADHFAYALPAFGGSSDLGQAIRSLLASPAGLQSSVADFG